MSESVISNLSDTARWVAQYRAQETGRPDPLFDDPFAAELAGETGRTIAAEARRTFGNGWFFIARTKLMDDLVMASVRAGCDRVVNLAAGMDTRPYRLPLPPDLEWVEIDLPELTAAKNQALDGHRPRCGLRREAVDLTDGAARRAGLDAAVDGASRALLITEGLLLYLAEAEVAALCAEAGARPFRWWIADVVGPAVVTLSAKASLRGKLNNAPVVFGPPSGVGYFETRGWTVEDMDFQIKAAARWRRLSRSLRMLAALPIPDPRAPGRMPWSAVLRLSNDNRTTKP